MLYAIGDLHLSFSTNKSMEVFGGAWEGYVDKIRQGFANLTDDDVCVICGDLSWGMDLEAAAEDFRFIDQLPGKKIILKGNHDYWWSTASKANAMFVREGITTISILHNNCYFYGDTAICGTRGWFYEEETGSEHDKKIMNRELQRLETSLNAAGEAKRKLCFLHYPPRYYQYVCREIVELLHKHGVTDCYYGHLHAYSHRHAITGLVEKVMYHNVASDHINFTPVPII